MELSCVWVSSDWTLGKSFFTERVAGHWNRLCKEVVMAPNLTEFKECLDNICSHMGRRELDSVILMDPLEFKIFYNSTTLGKCQQAAAREHRQR